jgi:hypothetical protein
MTEPIGSWDEFGARGEALEQEMDREPWDMRMCEHLLAELKAQLAYVRHCLQALERHRHDRPVEQYRDLRRRLRSMLRHLKGAHYEVLKVQEANLHLAAGG